MSIRAVFINAKEQRQAPGQTFAIQVMRSMADRIREHDIQ